MSECLDAWLDSLDGSASQAIAEAMVMDYCAPTLLHTEGPQGVSGVTNPASERDEPDLTDVA